MLRTMITEAPFEQKWTLQGRLCGQWAVDLKRLWRESRPSRMGCRCTVDLEDVVSVDPAGESVLLEMTADGAKLESSRAYMKFIMETLLAGLEKEPLTRVDH